MSPVQSVVNVYFVNRCITKMNVGQSRLFKRKCVKTISALILQGLTDMLEVEILKKKRIWIRKWISDRTITGGSSLLQQLRGEDPSEYRLALRLTSENFDELLSLIESSIQHQDTVMRKALPAKIKLEVTLSDSINIRVSISFSFRVILPLSLFTLQNVLATVDVSTTLARVLGGRG
jgi:hypothetical protein